MSYQNLNDLVEEIKGQLAKLENQELSVSDIDAIQENAQELYERLTVLKYAAIEKLVKPAESPEAKPDIEEKEPSTNTEPATETDTDTDCLVVVVSPHTSPQYFLLFAWCRLFGDTGATWRHFHEYSPAGCEAVRIAGMMMSPKKNNSFIYFFSGTNE